MSNGKNKKPFDWQRPPQIRLSLDNEIVVDNFAGGGGASMGMEQSIGRSVDIAINHDKEAIAMHEANHPETDHHCEDVFKVDPVKVCAGRPVGLAWFSPDCFPAGTMILTREGYRNIEQVSVGDEVLTHNNRWRQITEINSTHKSLIRLQGHGHPGLSVSHEHPFYARQRLNTWNNEHRSYDKSLNDAQWTPASILDKGWYWATPSKFPKSDVPEIPIIRNRETTITTTLMWLVGRYIADGWTRLTESRAELVITCGRHEVEDLRKHIDVWKRVGTRSGSDEFSWRERETGTAYQFSTNHKGFVIWLRQHFGHGAAEKFIPGWALGMREDLRKALLDGYISGDGWTGQYKNEITECRTVSKALAFGVKSLAVSLGKTVAVYTGENTNKIDGRLVNALPYWQLRWRTNITESHRQTFHEDDMEWSPVRNQKDAGDAEVFNIGVDEDESYVVEGIVVHNCKHFSKAKGGKPVSKKIRGLARVAIRWARQVKPRVIILENVEEFQDWGPLLENNKPCPDRKGIEFERFKQDFKKLGYQVDHKVLRACDYGAPTIRKRLFMIARCDGLPIVWPEATHGKEKGLLPYNTAADCIDWTHPVHSIFLTKEEGKKAGCRRPLADNTMRRVAKGTYRYVLNAKEPFVVPPAFITEHANASVQRNMPIDEPLRTICAEIKGGHFALVAPFLAKHYTGVVGHEVTKPFGTVTGVDHHSVVTSNLIHLRNNCNARDVRAPLPTLTAGGGHVGEVRAFLVKYYGVDQDPRLNEPMHTVTSQDRFGLVTVSGQQYQIIDIGMRMLQPRELYRAQGFPDEYIITLFINGKALSKAAQVRMCGNSVCPPMAKAIVDANYSTIELRKQA